MNIIGMLDDVMGCVVAFIPEGMPVGVALNLTIIARRIKSNNILPKGLSAVEMLGCVNVICSDKTGTLTENKMVLTTIGFVDKLMTVDEAFSALSKGNLNPLNELHQASILCSDASFDVLSMDRPVMSRDIQGNATDGTVLKYAVAAQEGSSRTINDAHPKVFHIPFNFKNKWMLTLHKTTNDSTRSSPCKPCFLMLVKGAPDVLEPRCANYWSYESNSIKTLNFTAKAQFLALQEELSRNAERVILLCQRYVTPSEVVGSNAFADEIQATCIADLTTNGVLGITALPRKETASTIAACRRAGIRFFMVTGNFGLTRDSRSASPKDTVYLEKVPHLGAPKSI